MSLMLGKLPFTPDRLGRDLLFKSYLKVAELPPIPPMFGHEDVYPRDQWGMLGNDTAGDCVFAGGAHETMLWNAVGGHKVEFTPESVLADYSAVTGYDPNNPLTDQGTNVRTALLYRQKEGLLDAQKVRHKIGAFVALDPGNISHLEAALYLFEAVGLGFRFPDSAMQQFNAGEVWVPVPGANIEGGHYVPMVCKRQHYKGITWSRLQGFTPEFYEEYCDEAWGILSPEMLVADVKSAEGLDLRTLLEDLTAVQGG